MYCQTLPGLIEVLKHLIIQKQQGWDFQVISTIYQLLKDIRSAANFTQFNTKDFGLRQNKTLIRFVLSREIYLVVSAQKARQNHRFYRL